MTLKVYRRVESPMNEVVFLENFGALFVASIIFELELEERGRTFPDKTDKYFYATILSVLRDNGRPYIPFK
jgi:hypothetical protein